MKEGYTRVTELLKPWSTFGSIPQEVLDNKAEIGTNVHSAINSHILGLPVPHMTEREQGYFESYLRWEAERNPVYAMTEERFYDDELMLTGQVDGIVSIQGLPGAYIIDFKTSAAPRPKDWPIQIGWYYLLAVHNGHNVSRNGYMLQLKDTGGKAKEYVYEIDGELIDTCMAIYNAYNYFRGKK